MTTAKENQTNIHPTAIVSPSANIGNRVTVEAYAIIQDHVTLEDDVTIKAHAYIDGHTTIGEGTTIWPFAAIGTKTQDLKYQGEITYVKIGKHCDIREYVTINSSCTEGSTVEVGDHCLIMAYCHVAHQCKVGNHVIMSNCATLAGHVTVEDYAIIGGLTGVHQFCRIGKYSMIGAMSRIGYDIPPYTIGGGTPYRYGGINLVGLKRHKFPENIKKLLTKAFKILHRSKYSFNQALEKIEEELEPVPEIKHFLKFCKTSKRGILMDSNLEN